MSLQPQVRAHSMYDVYDKKTAHDKRLSFLKIKGHVPPRIYLVEILRLRQCEALTWAWTGKETEPITTCLSTAWSSITTNTCKACSAGKKLCALPIFLCISYVTRLCFTQHFKYCTTVNHCRILLPTANVVIITQAKLSWSPFHRKPNLSLFPFSHVATQAAAKASLRSRSSHQA